ncbi:MAG TPA: ABC transporter permease [Aestuariivirga sp.]|nr:ABC transporter permease [Alphaproteobacteria bacterium]HRX35182.1 ABC transporter permease [Aestuariivirga sp.]
MNPRERTGLFLAAPTVLYMAFFFVLPAFLLFVYSFYRSKAYVPIPDFVFDNYARALTSKGFWLVVWLSVKVGLSTGAISVAASFPVAWYIVYRTRGNALLYLILASWITSYLVRIYGWRMILGSNGFVNTTLVQLGIIDQPLDFLLYNPVAVVIALVHIYLPLTLLMLISSLRDVRPEYLEAARDLGAGSTTTLLKVIVPMINRGLTGAFMFTTVLAAGDYVAPQVLGGTNSVTAGLLISNQFRATGNWPFGAALAFVNFAVFVAVYFAFTNLLRLAGLAPNRRIH